MVRLRTPLYGREIANIGSELSEIARLSSQTEAKLQKLFGSARKLPSSVEKEAKRVHSRLIKESRELEKHFNVLIKQKQSLNDGSVKEAKSLERQIKLTDKVLQQNKQKIDTLDRIIAREEKQDSVLKRLSSSMGGFLSRITQMVSIGGILTAVWSGVVSIFNTWFELQQKWAAASGTLIQRTGAYGSQFRQLRGVAESLRTTFGRLNQDVTGIADSMEFAGEIAVSMRSLVGVSDDMAMSMLEVSRGFGLSGDQATRLFRLVTLGSRNPAEEMQRFGADILRFADQIQAPAALIAQDYVAAAANIAQFGQEGESTFRDAALMASRFGFETRKVFDMVKGFDTFQQASSNVNTLNAMFGTTLSSFELMMEQDPTQRLEMIRGELMSVGMNFANMNRFQRMQIAQTLGISEDEAARVFQEGLSFEDMERERAAAQARQARNQEMQMSNQEMMNRLLMSTSVVFEDIDRLIQRIKIDLAEAFGPIFEEVYSILVDIGKEFGNWLKELVKTREFQTTIRDIVEKIKEFAQKVVEWFRKIDWQKVSRDAGELWDKLKKVGEVLYPIFEFIVEHPEALAVFLAAAAALKLLGTLSSIATLIGPGGSLLAGSSTLAATLGGAAIPLATIAGSYVVAQQADAARTAEGRQIAAGNSEARGRIGTSALQELERRASGGEQVREGGGFMQRLGSAMTNAQEASGFIGSSLLGQQRFDEYRSMGLIRGLSGQEADLRRNSLGSVIQSAATSIGGTPEEIEQRIRQSLGSEGVSALERETGTTLRQMIGEAIVNDPTALNRMARRLGRTNAETTQILNPAGGATVTSPSAAGVAGTNTPAAAPQNVNVNVQIDMAPGATNVLAARHVNSAVSGR